MHATESCCAATPSSVEHSAREPPSASDRVTCQTDALMIQEQLRWAEALVRFEKDARLVHEPVSRVAFTRSAHLARKAILQVHEGSHVR